MGANQSSAFGVQFQNTLARETWALYGLGAVIIGIRTYARARKLGFRNLQTDDYLMLVALAFYTMLIVCLNLTAEGAGSALALPGEDVMTFSPSVIDARALGAKIDLLAEVGMLNTIWVLKACMLIFYHRLTAGLPSRQLLVKLLAIYVAIGWVAIEFAFFLQCRPFHNYWQIAPSPNLNCMTLWAYAITQATFNISSDVMMLLIPLPLVLAAAVPLKQKAVLAIIFSMGTFVIIAAILTKVEFFTDVYSDSYMFWYAREASVAVYVANLPCIWPLLRELLPVLKSWTPGRSTSTGTRAASSGGGVLGSHNAIRRGTIRLSRRSVEEFQRIVDTKGTMEISVQGLQTGDDGAGAFSPRSGWGRCKSSRSEEAAGDEENGLHIRQEKTFEMSVLDQDESMHDDGQTRAWA